MLDLALVAFFALVVAAPFAVIAWAFIEDAMARDDDPHEPGDQSHHPASIEQARRANGRRGDA